jgi:mRNA-degrading endonuclease RelE of RelBE toxin-antitoxin system
MNIQTSRAVDKFLVKIQPKIAKRIVYAIEKLPLGDVKPIVGTKNEYRLRVGAYRILLIITDDFIYITNIKTRGKAYKK